MAVRGWCSVAMMVCPSAARQDMWSMMFSAANESRPAHGVGLQSGMGVDVRVISQFILFYEE